MNTGKREIFFERTDYERKRGRLSEAFLNRLTGDVKVVKMSIYFCNISKQRFLYFRDKLNKVNWFDLRQFSRISRGRIFSQAGNKLETSKARGMRDNLYETLSLLAPSSFPARLKIRPQHSVKKWFNKGQWVMDSKSDSRSLVQISSKYNAKVI
jgi:hypothetical protein